MFISFTSAFASSAFPLSCRFLLGWLFADRHSDDSPGRQNAFVLLRAVLSRKIVVPEVYDVMDWVQEVMVK